MRVTRPKKPVAPRKTQSKNESAGFGALVWEDTQPYMVCLVSDTILLTGLWLVLFLFHELTVLLKVSGAFAEVVQSLHGASIVMAVVLFVCKFLLSVIRIYTEKGKK